MKSWRASPFYCSFCLAFFLSANCFGAGSEIKSVSLDHRLSKQTSLKSSVDSFVPPESKDSQLSGFDLTDPKSVAAYCETLARGKVHAPLCRQFASSRFLFAGSFRTSLAKKKEIDIRRASSAGKRKRRQLRRRSATKADKSNSRR